MLPVDVRSLVFVACATLLPFVPVVFMGIPLEVVLEKIASGLVGPTDLVTRPDGTLVVIDQPGRVYAIVEGKLQLLADLSPKGGDRIVRMKRDYDEEQQSGQKVSKTAHQANYFVRNSSNNRDDVKTPASRFLQTVFGVHLHTPTIDEKGMMEAVSDAVAVALQRSRPPLAHPYGDGRAGERIAAELAARGGRMMLRKRNSY